ncbi:MAG: FAD-dependent oxidoreductase [Patescibacteria group bacterium]|nr:FAD-dependent oxidoreductase [Patescibacteria group bacterium]
MKTVGIVGAGPAGLFAAQELAQNTNLRIVVFDQGKEVTARSRDDPFDLLHGIGGSGTFSDGKLNFHPQIGGDLFKFMSYEDAWKLVNHIETVFQTYGVEVISTEKEKVRTLERRAAEAGFKFLPIRQAHIGSDHLVELVSTFARNLRKSGVEFQLKTKVTDISTQRNTVAGILTKEGFTKADFVLLAPGRTGCSWTCHLAEKHNLTIHHNPVDIGVRVEVPSIIMEPITNICYDPKFYIRTPTYDDRARTFCVSPNGLVVSETYDGGYVCVNGHALRDSNSPNTNFALLVSINLTQPVESTSDYGESIARLATTIGGGKPLLQSLGDLRRNRRSTWHRLEKSRSDLVPTLTDVTPGDISMALPHRVVTDIKEALSMLSNVIPGLNTNRTLLYAPKLKRYAARIETNTQLETKIENLFVAGDGAGNSRGIVGAAAMGIIAARGIGKELQ